MVQLRYLADTKNIGYFFSAFKNTYSFEVICHLNSRMTFKPVWSAHVSSVFFIHTVFFLSLFNAQVHMIQKSCHTHTKSKNTIPSSYFENFVAGNTIFMGNYVIYKLQNFYPKVYAKYN